MLQHFILLFFCFSCVMWALTLFLNRKRNTKAQNIWTVFIALMAVCSFIWSIYYNGIEDYSLYYKLDMIDTVLSLFLFPTLFFYFKSMKSEKLFHWRDIVWLLPGLVIGTISIILYLIMGDPNAAGYLEELTLTTGKMEKYTAPLYRMQFFINVWGFYIAVLIQLVSVIIYGTLLLSKHLQKGDSYNQSRSVLIGLYVFFPIYWGAILSEYFSFPWFNRIILVLMIMAGITCYFMGYRVYSASVFGQADGTISIKKRKRNETENRTITTGAVSIPTGQSGKYPFIIQRFNQLMDEKIYLQSQLHVEDIASMLKTNRTYISKLLKEEFNCSFTELINKKRIEYARELMATHPLMTQELIAEKCGFIHTSSFSRIFKQYTGMTFREYQKTLQFEDITVQA